jgi:curved DNA-binding protein
VANKDYYKTLGVARGASQDDIKKAYRRLVRQHHPDVSRASNAEQKTKELNEAYDVLGDATKRAAYDRQGSDFQSSQPYETPPGGAGNEGYADSAQGRDFFADLFAHVGRRGRSAFRMRGEDIRAPIAIDLRDSYLGASKIVTVRLAEPDPSGRSVMRERRINVSIPKGVLAGQQLRMAGQGQAGTGGAAAGDLLLDVAFNPSEPYQVDGRDVSKTVPVTPWEAALGAQIDVPTPSGAVRVNVPAGSQNGRKLRLKGRGIPATPPGDLYLLLDIVLPPADSARARALYEQMARELAFDPRSARRA